MVQVYMYIMCVDIKYDKSLLNIQSSELLLAIPIDSYLVHVISYPRVTLKFLSLILLT